MSSLGVAVNGAWSFKTQDLSRRVRRKKPAARVILVARTRQFDNHRNLHARRSPAKDIGDFNGGPGRMKAGAGHDPRPGAFSS